VTSAPDDAPTPLPGRARGGRRLRGLAAATALAEAGAGVLLLEARPYLGGRARSWSMRKPAPSSTTGSISSWDATGDAQAPRSIGARDRLGLQARFDLPLADAAGSPPSGCRRCRTLELLLGCCDSGLDLSGRLALLRVARDVARRSRPPSEEGPTSWTTAASTNGSPRSGRVPRRTALWHPLAIASLNERPDRASAAISCGPPGGVPRGAGDRASAWRASG